jgi:hypothetical protein
MRFIFTKEVYELGVRGAYFNIRGMCNLTCANPRVRAFVESQLPLVPHDLEGSATLRGFAELHATVSTRPNKLVAAPASLLALFRRKKDIPRVNGIVDVYNAVSLASGLAIGAHDLAQIDGDIELRLNPRRRKLLAAWRIELQPHSGGRIRLRRRKQCDPLPAGGAAGREDQDCIRHPRCIFHCAGTSRH